MSAPQDALALVALATGVCTAEEADAATLLAVGADPTSFEAWMARGTLLARKNEEREAIAALSRAAAIEPENVAVHTHLGELALRLLDYELAATELALAIQLDPQATTPFGARAQALVARALMVLSGER